MNPLGAMKFVGAVATQLYAIGASERMITKMRGTKKDIIKGHTLKEVVVESIESKQQAGELEGSFKDRLVNNTKKKFFEVKQDIVLGGVRSAESLVQQGQNEVLRKQNGAIIRAVENGTLKLERKVKDAMKKEETETETELE